MTETILSGAGSYDDDGVGARGLEGGIRDDKRRVRDGLFIIYYYLYV